VSLRPGVRVRDFLHELASVFWRTLWMEIRPCCLGQRYGHGWQHGWEEQVTHGGEWPTQTLYVPEGYLLLGYVQKRSPHPNGVTIDYVALMQGPPAACPECGCPPPRARMKAWREHLERHQGGTRGTHRTQPDREGRAAP
jgi:hypothetical protein